ncbi:hypothetical protein [Vibrio algarum]|uniref:Uncharacterized protein n=1 Tax=Vibrio algarum TaxID=3020714 RepID=A0ABT4YRP1_9VIBR|nr:hypothetical protein [Vibrio sp. KJ40-1]MDB1124220.1 hypothetical protein [Vibrio sp. KJ40-1]
MKLSEKVKVTFLSSKVMRMVFRVIIALVISIFLTILCAVYIPPIFKSVLNTGLEILPKYKFTDHKVLTKSELIAEWEIDKQAIDDESIFEQLESQLPESRNKSTFFARILVVHDYPERCQYTIIAKHRTIDVSWQVSGLRCHSKKSCEAARLHQTCPDKKGGGKR